MSLTVDTLIRILPLSRPYAGRYVNELNMAMAEFQITGRVRQASFIAQIGHESAQLSRVSENLNYGAPGLLSTFRRHFSPADAQTYARQPERIANRAYANRNGNGNEASGDGWKYRGRGLIQITGRSNYAACGLALGLDLINHPELLELPLNACRSAAWFWYAAGLNAAADAGDQLYITKRINGGTNGLHERLAFFEAGSKVIV